MNDFYFEIIGIIALILLCILVYISSDCSNDDCEITEEEAKQMLEEITKNGVNDNGGGDNTTV